MHFDETVRNAVYAVIEARRDVRGEFLPDPIDDATLKRLLTAAHMAPSVGFMQPWDFIVVRSAEKKRAVKSAFLKAHERAAALFPEEKRGLYKSLKLEGIEEAPIGICVTCDRSRFGPTVIGRTSQPEMDLYSSVCAIQNLWLAARAENIGLGWVSIIEHDDLREILGIPGMIVPIAWLCLGRVSAFHEKPELEKVGWGRRVDLAELVHEERFDGPAPAFLKG